MKKLIKDLLQKFDLKLVHAGQTVYNEAVPNELEPEFLELYAKCKPFTMTTIERMYAVYKAVEYTVQNNLSGAMVECGVWRGGSSMMIALTLLKKGKSDVSLYLYDTFEGMPEPTEKDKSLKGEAAYGTWKENQKTDVNEWCYSSLDDVKSNLYSTGYPKDKIYFIKGKVEDTLPATLPSDIALLRLDTDWYDSTYHELIHLYPLLRDKGVLIIDDYGHWQGAREAVDQYFKEKNIAMLLNRIDYTGRIGIKW